MAERPRIVVIFTGGTIAMLPDAGGAAVPALRGAEIVASVPGLATIAEVETLDWGLVPASHLQFTQILEIGRHIHDAAARPEVDGVVVVQGTDVLEETAFAWDLLHRSDTPVVVVGAMRHAGDPGADGPRNLLDAVRVAAHPAMRDQGVVVVMAGLVLPADDATKLDSRRDDAFQAPNHGPLGSVGDDGVHLQRDRGPRRTLPGPAPTDARGGVALLTAVVSMDGELLRAAVARGAAGVVVEATGAGNSDPDLLAAATEAMAKGIPVVLTTRCVSGGVAPEYGFPGGGRSWLEAGALPGGTLSGPKARVALTLGSAAGLDPAGLAALDSAPGLMARADLIITGRIATLRGAMGFGWAGALAIGAGRVLGVGRAADVEALAGRGTRHWRLGADVVVTPSLTDAHLHLTSAALAAGQPDLTGLDLAAVGAAINQQHRLRLKGGDVDGWILGHGWSLAALGAIPTAASLDAAAPGRPVALWAHDHHTRWLSRAAMDVSGIAEAGDPPAGRIGRDDLGQPTGILFEHAAGLVDAAIPPPAAVQVEAALRTFARHLAGLGVTSIHDPGSLAPDPLLHWGPARYEDMAAAGDLPLRVTASVREEQLDGAIEAGFRSGRAGAGGPSGRYRDGWLKLFADGALGSRTAALLEPYEVDDPCGPPPGGPSGMMLRSLDELAELTRRAAAAGIASQLHALGDAAVRSALDVLETVAEVPGAGHRIEHAQLIDAEDVPRFAKLRVAASVQPCHLLSDAGAVRAAWGSRAGRAFPLADLDGAGASIAFGTDAPVERPDPWPGIAAAVTRRGSGWPPDAALHAEQGITLARALRAACLDGPRSARIDDEGHLGPGARADLLVLPAVAFDEPPDPARLAATRPLVTLLDGAIMHVAPGFDP